MNSNESNSSSPTYSSTPLYDELDSSTSEGVEAKHEPPHGAPVTPPPANMPPCSSQNTPPGPPPKPVRHGWKVAIVAIVAAALVCVFGIWSCSSALTKVSTSTAGASSLTSNAVAVIELDSSIAYDGSLCSPEGLKEQLDIAANNDYIVAVVLRVNSGGGTATAGEEMATYVREFCEETGKPVVVSSASTNASAAYEISSQADYIYVAKTTSIGSIGTVLQITDYSGLLELLGIEVSNIASAESKDSTYGTRSLTEEEIEYYQEQVDAINSVFIENVAYGRNMTIEEVEQLATGLTFTGMEACENGLADEIGTVEDAVSKAAELAECESYETIELTQGSTSGDISALLDLLSAQQSGVTTQDIIDALEELETSDVAE